MQIQRKSYFEISRTYFFTATIHQWLPLLSSKENKELIINYLKENYRAGWRGSHCFPGSVTGLVMLSPGIFGHQLALTTRFTRLPNRPTVHFL